MQKRNIKQIAMIVGTLLIVPLFGNLFIEGWNWGPLDFVLLGAMLFVVGLAMDFVTRKIKKPAQRTLALAVIAVTFLLLWAELAVDAVSQLLSFLF